MSPSLLEVAGIRAGYGDIPVLKGIDLEVREGELVSILGANGAGKTTLLRVVSGMLAPSAGEVWFRGDRVTGLRPHRLVGRGLAHVPEGREILGRLTVEENLRLGAYRRRNRADVERDLETMYDRFPVLSERCRQVAGTLSGGEQQQLAIGRALMAGPSLLLLDEPSLGLAPVLVDRVFELISGLKAEGRTILLVEQNTRHALRLADRVYVQKTGRIVLEGPTEEIIADEGLHAAYLGGAARPPSAPKNGSS